MKLLMISGDRSILRPAHQSAFIVMLEEFRHHFERIDIICPRGIAVLHEPRALYDNVFVHASSSHRLLHPFFIHKKGTELFMRFHHDVMTVHEYPPFLNGLGARMLQKKIKIPMVMEIHHIVGFPHAASISEYVGRWMTRMFIAWHSRFFDAVRVVNATVQFSLIDFGVCAEKISIVPSVYLDHALLDQAKGEQKTYDMVFAARLVENKGLMAVIDAVAEMSGKTLLVVGDGPLKKEAEAHVRAHGIASRVTFTGFISDAMDYAKAVSSGRIFLMNSKSEGNPRVAVEAMALGLPILATRVGIMPDIVKDGENGMFTDGSAADIVTKATTLLSDATEIARMGKNATAVKNRFERNEAIKTYASFLKNVARGDTGRLDDNSSKRLLFITQKLKEQDAFGVLWVREFLRQGFPVDVICLEGSHDTFEFPVHSLGKEHGASRLQSVLKFEQLIMTLTYDRVFIHMAPVWYALGFWYWILRRTPTYLWYTHYQMQLGVKLFGWFGTRFFCATPQSLPQFEGSLQKSVVGHGIDLSLWPKRQNVCRDGRKLLVVHRISRSKRLEIIVRAMPLLDASYTLDVYGFEAEPDYTAELKNLVGTLHLQSRVTFHGRIDMHKLPEIYVQHRLILNMASETIDKTMLEAMTCGCYPVTTAANAEAIGSLIAPSSDTSQAIAEFVQMYTEKAPIDAERMYEIVERNHSLERLVKRMGEYMKKA